MKKSILMAVIAAFASGAALADCSCSNACSVKLDNGFAEMLQDQAAQFPVAATTPHATQGDSYTPAK